MCIENLSKFLLPKSFTLFPMIIFSQVKKSLLEIFVSLLEKVDCIPKWLTIYPTSSSHLLKISFVSLFTEIVAKAFGFSKG